MLFAVIIYFGFLFLMIASVWKIFTKAGQPGWACLIPIYGFYVQCEFTGVKNWWLIFIPVANIYIAIVAIGALGRSFGKDPVPFGFGLVFLPFISIQY